MKREFDIVNQIIKNYFDSNLISLVIFGSFCRKKKFKIISDLDYIIILKKKINNQDVVSRRLKKILNKYFALLSFNIYNRDAFINIIKNQDWLVLSIHLGYYVVFDRNNFFIRLIEKRYYAIKSKKIAPLGWYIKNISYDDNFIAHLLNLSSKYLKCSKVVFQNRLFDVANLLLLHSVHRYLSALLLKRNIFITKGEISQCFIKNYGVGFNNKLANNILELEQVCGQIEKISFNFTQNGTMKYIKNNKYLYKFYMNKSNAFKDLKRKFNLFI